VAYKHRLEHAADGKIDRRKAYDHDDEGPKRISDVALSGQSLIRAYRVGSARLESLETFRSRAGDSSDRFLDQQ
jgi:hypothetical protein